MSADPRLVHYSRKKLDELRPLTYEELTQDRTSGRWADKPDLAAKYVEDRRKFEKDLHKRLAARGITTKPDTSFLYATLSGHERFGVPGQYKHEAELTPELINSSFFDVVGAGKSRTTFGQKGLLAALKKWKEAEKANALKEQEYMGMPIRPRIEFITPNSLKPVSVSGGNLIESLAKEAVDRVRVVSPYVTSSSGVAIKTAAPAWVRMLRANKLSPESLQRITSNMSEGTVRYIKSLGHGMTQQADLLAGNIGGQAGMVVRKLPRHAISPADLAAESSRLQQASKIIENRFPGVAAQYLPANASKGIFQQYGIKEVVPGWDKLKPTLSMEQLNRPMSVSPEFKKVYDPVNAMGVTDIHGGNVGPRGQLIDYMYRLPQNAPGNIQGLAGGLSPVNTNITPESQGFFGRVKIPKKIPMGTMQISERLTPENAKAYIARVDNIKAKVDAAKAKAYAQMQQAFRKPTYKTKEKLDQNAIRKYWLGKGQPVEKTDYYVIKPSRQEQINQLPLQQELAKPTKPESLISKALNYLPNFLTRRW